MSTIAPRRKPSRMPFFTQPLTRQPVLAAGVGLGGADRAGVQGALELVEEAEVLFGVLRRLVVEELLRFVAEAFEQVRGLRAPGESWLRSLGCGAHMRQPPDRLEQAHHRHRGFHRNRIRFDEVALPSAAASSAA